MPLSSPLNLPKGPLALGQVEVTRRALQRDHRAPLEDVREMCKCYTALAPLVLLQPRPSLPRTQNSNCCHRHNPRHGQHGAAGTGDTARLSPPHCSQRSCLPTSFLEFSPGFPTSSDGWAPKYFPRSGAGALYGTFQPPRCKLTTHRPPASFRLLRRDLGTKPLIWT